MHTSWMSAILIVILRFFVEVANGVGVLTAASIDSAATERRCNLEGPQCQNGGWCDAFLRPDGDTPPVSNDRLVCMCPIGHTGQRCEIEGNFKFPEFHGNGYMAFELNSAALSHSNLEIGLEILPRLSNGLVLFAGTPSAFIALLLRDSKLELRYDTGGSGLSVLSHPSTLSLRAWHSVSLRRSGSGTGAWLQVNESRQTHGSDETVDLPDVRPESSGRDRTRDNADLPSRSLLFVAGLPRRPSTEAARVAVNAAVSASSRVGLNTDAGFVGCIGNVSLGGRPLDPRLKPFHGDASEGVNVYDCAMATCNRHRCLNRGECKVLRPPDLYMCLCQNSSGAYCQSPITERISAPSFDGSAHLNLRSMAGLRRTSRSCTDIRLAFRAEQPDGLLLYAGYSQDRRGDFLAIGLLQRRVVAAFDLGSGAVVLRSRELIDLHAWTIVEFNRLGRRGRLRVSGQAGFAEGYSPGGLVQLTVQQDTVLGGLADYDSASSALPVRQNFVGCLHEVSFGELGRAVFPRDIETSVNVRQCRNYTCDQGGGDAPNGFCGRGGDCVLLEGRGGGFGCQCQLGFFGQRCDKFTDPKLITAPYFAGSGFLLYRSRDAMKAASGATLNISLSVKLRANYAASSLNKLPSTLLLLLSESKPGPSGRKLHLTVIQRHLLLNYNEGYGLKVKQNLYYFDHNWHRIMVIRTTGRYSVFVDGRLKGVAEDSEIGSGEDQFDKLLLGGVDPDTWQSIEHCLTEANPSSHLQWPPRRPLGFDGCIRDASLASSPASLGQPWRLLASAAEIGSNVLQCAADAPSNN